MKQYLLMVDEVGMNLLSHILKQGTFQYLAVEGMPLNNDGRYHVMITPVVLPLPPADLTPQQPATEAQQVTHDVQPTAEVTEIPND